jgi:hypothetical protein
MDRRSDCPWPAGIPEAAARVLQSAVALSFRFLRVTRRSSPRGKSMLLHLWSRKQAMKYWDCGCRQDARILEKQNSLRMSQIFSCIRTIVIRWFCFFKDSPSEAASPRRRCSQPDLDTPTPRRSEARLRWPYCNNIQGRPRLFVLFHRPADPLEKDIRGQGWTKIGGIRGSDPLRFKSFIENNL